MPPPEAKEISYATLGRVLGNTVRWRVLALLAKHEVLPRGELVTMLGEERSRLSKHLRIMVGSGVIEYWHRTLFRIPAHFRVPGENLLDFGCAVIRIDRVK